MILEDLFQEYELLVAKADQCFQKIKMDYEPCIKCSIQCSDCCYAVFGLFLIESVYLKDRFNKLSSSEKRKAIIRGNKSDKDFLKIEKKLEKDNNYTQIKTFLMERERVRCPLLNGSQECVLYPFRPITCRVYGIPTIINGKVHVCWKAGFKKGQAYPAFNLDILHRELYRLSIKLLERTRQENMEKASLLLSVSKSIRTPIEKLINE